MIEVLVVIGLVSAGAALALLRWKPKVETKQLAGKFNPHLGYIVTIEDEGTELDVAWRECITMWEWIVEHFEPGNVRYATRAEYINSLKCRYVEKMEVTELTFFNHHCFFCAYRMEHSNMLGMYGCKEACPGVLASDTDWHCTDNRWSWESKPVEFLAELKRLERKGS